MSGNPLGFSLGTPQGSVYGNPLGFSLGTHQGSVYGNPLGSVWEPLRIHMGTHQGSVYGNPSGLRVQFGNPSGFKWEPYSRLLAATGDPDIQTQRLRKEVRTPENTACLVNMYE